MRAWIGSLLIFAALVARPAELRADPSEYVVIVHPENPTTRVSRRFLADAFLKR